MAVLRSEVRPWFLFRSWLRSRNKEGKEKDGFTSCIYFDFGSWDEKYLPCMILLAWHCAHVVEC